MGRPSKLTPERWKLIVEKRGKGLPLIDCAALAGMQRSTLQGWLQKGRLGIKPYADFLDAMTRAEAISIEGLLAVIVQDAKINASTAQWLISRRRHEDFGTHQNHHHKGTVEHRVVRVKEEPDEIAAVSGNLRERVDELMSATVH